MNFERYLLARIPPADVRADGLAGNVELSDEEAKLVADVIATNRTLLDEAEAAMYWHVRVGEKVGKPPVFSVAQAQHILRALNSPLAALDAHHAKREGQ